MNFQKISCTLWLTVFLVSLLFIGGCGRPTVSLSFPLANGNTWTYQGMLTYKLGKQDQSMPPLTFNLVCQQVGGKANLPYTLKLQEEGEAVWGVQLVSTVKGLVNPLSGEIWLPNAIKMRKKWNITIDGEKVSLIIRTQSSATVPAGTFPAYLIEFTRLHSGKGSIWLNPDVGIIAGTWISKTPGGTSTTHLELSSYAFP